ncbi:MAG: DUF3556 domain-containing protein [Myxococcota bacterium]|nr:DUF3556 domain-containing protein [Myxococcota bacterium]
MSTSARTEPPYEPEQILAAPFAERIRLVCQTWASQAMPNPKIVMALYWTKYIVLYVGGFAFFASFNASYPGFTSPLEWAFTTTSFKKMIAWSILYELTGLGCSWGPMNGRIKPMLGGIRNFLWVGTIKLPLFPGVPVIGSPHRGWLDVGVYGLNHLLLLRALLAPEVTTDLLLPCFVLLPIMGVLDKTLFLAARAEHYYVALVCLVVAAQDDLWIAGCKVVWALIWFWAATSKLNHHFPTVIMFMMNNGPFFPKALKKRLFADYPDDLRPSRLATFMAHFGTVAEYSIPLLLLTSPNEIVTVLALMLMVSFHGFIALNNPNGMPVDWNILMIYGGIFLFGFHPEPGVGALAAMPGLVVFLFLVLVVMQTYGNFVPKHVSFLLSMRYYAGNWAYNLWLFRKDGAIEKLRRLKTPGGILREQMRAMKLEEQEIALAAEMTMAMRFTHLQGRPLQDALPRAVDDMDDYEWQEGEVLGGQIVGWNFGDGHLNGKQLLDSVQAVCGFEPGELRMVSIESQPLFGSGWEWKIFDAATGLVDSGRTEVADVLHKQPWPTGQDAAAFARGATRTAS